MKIFITFCFVALVGNLFAQQDPQYTQYMYNMNVINPAYSGSKEGISSGLLYRSQWRGIEGAPQTGTFFVHSPIGNKLGLGLSIINDQIGPVEETNLYTDFSYTLKLGSKHHLAFGIKAGATFHDIGLARLDLIDSNDIFFQNISSVTPNIGAGVFYYSENHFLAASVPNILSAVHLDANGNKLGSEQAHYFITGGYVFEYGEMAKLKPSFLVKSSFGSTTSFDLNLNALFYDKFEVGGSYRLGDSFSALINITIAKGFRIGYAYDAVTSDIKRYAPASHEILILLDLTFTRKVSRSPRYF